MDQSVLRQSECTIFNQPYLQNKSMKQPDFLLADISSYKLKVDQKLLGGHRQKWLWAVWSWDSEIDCISRMDRWNELIFSMLVQIQES